MINVCSIVPEIYQPKIQINHDMIIVVVWENYFLSFNERHISISGHSVNRFTIVMGG